LRARRARSAQWFLALALLIAQAAGAEEAPAGSAVEPATESGTESATESSTRPDAQTTSKPLPVHVSIGSGVFLPWDGKRGYNVSGTAHLGLGSDRFWVGGEFEYRHFEAEVKQDFRPDYNSFALRFQFQYHPFPAAVISPYVGIGVGVVLHKVDDNHSSLDSSDKLRSDVSGGFTLLGLAGIEVPIPFVDRLHVFGEGRLGNTSDFWKRKGGNFQMDQADGITGMGGLRIRF
jgi:hypothetical protein